MKHTTTKPNEAITHKKHLKILTARVGRRVVLKSVFQIEKVTTTFCRLN